MTHMRMHAKNLKKENYNFSYSFELRKYRDFFNKFKK